MEPWHNNIAGAHWHQTLGQSPAISLPPNIASLFSGNATEPLLMIFGVILLACILSGKWWMMAYALIGVVLYLVLVAYALYLEHDAQTELERRHRARSARPKPRRSYNPPRNEW